MNRPSDLTGDLLGLSLMEATVQKDLQQIDAILNQFETREHWVGALRTLCNASAAFMEQVLTQRGAEMQIQLFRDAMLQAIFEDEA